MAGWLVWRNAVSRWGWVLPAVVASLYVAFGAYAALGNKLVDFYMYYLAAAGFRQGLDVYTLSAGQLDALARAFSILNFEPPYKYPPVTAILVMPLLALPAQTAGFVWALLSGAAAIGSVALLNATRKDNDMKAAGWLVLLVFAPVLTTIYAGQVNTWVLLTIALAIWSYRRGRPFEAGLALALGTMIKLMPVVLLAYFLLRRKWRVVLGGAMGLAALTLLSVVILGPEIVLSYVAHQFLEAAPQAAVAYPPNQSLTGFFARLLTVHAWGPSLVDQPVLALWVGRAAGLLVVATALVLTVPGREVGQPNRFERDASILIIAMHLATSVSWYHHLALVLVPCLFLLWDRRYVTLAVALVLIDAQGLLWHRLAGLTPLLSLAAYALVVMFVVIARTSTGRAQAAEQVPGRSPASGGQEAGA